VTNLLKMSAGDFIQSVTIQKSGFFDLRTKKPHEKIIQQQKKLFSSTPICPVIFCIKLAVCAIK